MLEIIGLILAGGIGLPLVFLLLDRRAHFRHRHIDDIARFLPLVEAGIILNLLDPTAEASRLARSSSPFSRREQRVLLELLREQLLLMLRISTQLGHVGRTAYHDARMHQHEIPAEQKQSIEELISAASKFSGVGHLILVRMWFWRLSQFEKHATLPLPRLASFRRAGRSDLIETYRALIQAASAFATAQVEGEVGIKISEYLRSRMWHFDVRANT